MASSWILFFSYQDDVRSNTHEINADVFIWTARAMKTEWCGCCYQYINPFCHLVGPNTNRLVSSDSIQFIPNCTSNLLPTTFPNMTEYICYFSSSACIKWVLEAIAGTSLPISRLRLYLSLNFRDK